MSEYNFVPDYAAWWKKKNLSKDDIIWLILGADPDHIKRFQALCDKNDKTEGENSWYWAFYNRYDRKYPPSRIGEYHSRYKMILENLKKEKCFQVIYEYNLPIDEKAAAFALGNKLLKNRHELEQYKDHVNFLCDYDALDLASIKTEDQALGVLLGFNPTMFERFKRLFDKIRLEISQVDFFDRVFLSPDDRWFYGEFEKYVRHKYEIDAGFIFSIVNDLNKLNLWDGDFSAYIDRTYNEGFSFDDSVYQALIQKGVSYPSYQENSWAVDFYKIWITKRPLWDLEIAASLYRGADPDGKREFWSLRLPKKSAVAGYCLHSSDFVTFLDQKGDWVTPKNKDFEKETNLKEFVRQHVVLGNLIPSTDDGRGNYTFTPKAITEFFRDYCPNTHQPLSLFVVLNISTPKKNGENILKESAMAVAKKLAPKHMSPEKEQEDIMSKAIIFCTEYYEEHAKLPKKSDVVGFLRLKNNGYAHISEASLLKKFTMEDLLGRWRTEQAR